MRRRVALQPREKPQSLGRKVVAALWFTIDNALETLFYDLYLKYEIMF